MTSENDATRPAEVVGDRSFYGASWRLPDPGEARDSFAPMPSDPIEQLSLAFALALTEHHRASQAASVTERALGQAQARRSSIGTYLQQWVANDGELTVSRVRAQARIEAEFRAAKAAHEAATGAAAKRKAEADEAWDALVVASR